MSESMVVITASMPPSLIEAVRASAKRADRSFSAEIRVALRAYLEAQEDGATTGAAA